MWTIINSNNQIVCCVGCPEGELGQYLTEGSRYVAGAYSPHEYEIVDNEFRLRDTANAKIAQIKEIRKALLNETDLIYCNAERWTNMTTDKQQAWSAYKQALRDFPNTCDINNPIWPELPK